MRSLFIISLFIMTGTIVSSCHKKEKKTTTAQGQQGGASKQPAMRVDVYVVEPRSLSENLELPGSLIANEATEIHPEVSGRLELLEHEIAGQQWHFKGSKFTIEIISRGL